METILIIEDVNKSIEVSELDKDEEVEFIITDTNQDEHQYMYLNKKQLIKLQSHITRLLNK